MGNSEHHVLPMKVYLSVFITLLCLTAITVWVAQFDFGSLNTVVAMAVATVKASLVALYFMHLKYEKTSAYATCILGGVFFLFVMFIFSFVDVYSRVPIESTL